MTPDQEIKVISGKKKYALVIETDFALARSLTNVLENQGFTVVMAHSLKEVRSRVNTFKVSHIDPELVILCPNCACTSGPTLTEYIKRSFPKAKMIHTSKPQDRNRHNIPCLPFNKVMSEPKRSVIAEMASNIKIMERQMAVKATIRAKTLAMAEQAKKEQNQSVRADLLDKAAKREMLDSLLEDAFETKLRTNRKATWDYIKWRAKKMSLPLDFGYVKYMWKKFRNGYRTYD